MRAKTSIILAAPGFIVLAAAFAWGSFHAAGKTEASLASLTQRLDILETKVREAQAEMAEDKREARALRAKLDSVQWAPAAAASRLPGAASPAALTEADPKLLDLYLKSFRANLRQRFGVMYQMLGLSPAQIDRFEELATAHADESADLRAAALSQGLDPTDAGIAALRKQQNEQFSAAVAADVGVDASRQLQQIARLQPMEGVVAAMDSMAAVNAAPLTNFQAWQLTQALANSSPGYQAGGLADPNTINWAVAAEHATPILSAPQREAFQAEAKMAQVAELVRQFYAQQPAAE